MKLKHFGLFICWYLISILVFGSAKSHAACTEGPAGSFTCSGASSNTNVMTGETILDNTAAPASLNNIGADGQFYSGVGSIIKNDSSTSSIGEISTIKAIGGNQVEIVNTGDIRMVRAREFKTRVDPLTGLTVMDFQAVGGKLYNDSLEVGIAAAIFADHTTSALNVTNTIIPNTATESNRYGRIAAEGDFSAAIYASSAQVIINSEQHEGIVNYGVYSPSPFGGAPIVDSKKLTLEAGHWAIATFAGATYSPPVIQDGTQSATLITPGLTTLNIADGNIIGSVLITDKNPLLVAAQIADPSLALAYGINDVGPRDSIINITGGGINGNIYLGSGAHVINAAGYGYIDTIYVDQTPSMVTDAGGNPLYSVVGDRKFDYTVSTTGAINIYLNDTVGAVNNFTFLTNSSGTGSIVTNGIGTNVLNVDTSRDFFNIGNVTGMSSVDIKGKTVVFGDSDSYIRGGDAPIVLESRNDIHIDARAFSLGAGATLKADNIIFDNFSLLEGGQYFATVPLTGGLTRLDAIGDINGNLVFNSGQIKLQSAILDISGDATINATDIVTVFKPQGLGHINVGGNGTISGDSTIIPTLAGGFVTNGKSYIVMSNTTGTPYVVNNPSGRVSFSLSDDPNNIAITALVTLPTSVTSQLSRGGKNALDAIFSYPGDDPAFTKFAGEVLATSDTELGRVAERLRPEIHDGAIRMVLNHSDRMLGLVESRLFDSYMTSVKRFARDSGATSDLVNGSGIWAQGFGGVGTQQGMQRADGYTSTSTGLTAGIDRLVGTSQHLKLGAAFGYAWGNIDNSGITDNNRIDVNSYMGAIYSNWSNDDYYLNGALGLGRNTYASKRVALGRATYGNHDSYQLTAKVDAGWPFQIRDNLVIVPLAGVSYNRINESAYSESGENIISLNNGGYVPPTINLGSPNSLTIASRSFNSYRTALGAKAVYSLQQEDWFAGIELRALYNHEFGDIAQDSTARFVVGGDTFQSSGIRPVRDGFVVGSSLRLTGDDGNDQLSFLASYDADIRDKYFGQSLSMMLRYDFDQAMAYQKLNQARKAADAARAPPLTVPVKASEQDISTIHQAMVPASINHTEEPQDPVIQQVSQALDSWATALTDKNLINYFNSYSVDFVNAEGLTRQQWERQRRAQLSKEGKKEVRVSYLKVTHKGSQATVIFTQTRIEAGREDVTRKFMDLEQRNGRWLIVSEDSLPISSLVAADIR